MEKLLLVSGPRGRDALTAVSYTHLDQDIRAEPAQRGVDRGDHGRQDKCSGGDMHRLFPDSGLNFHNVLPLPCERRSRPVGRALLRLSGMRRGRARKRRERRGARSQP